MITFYLQELIANARHVLVLDAHLDNKTVSVMCDVAELTGRPKPFVRINAFPAPPLKAYEVVSDKPHQRHKKAAFLEALVQRLKDGENVYVVTASKGFGDEIMTTIADNVPEISEVRFQCRSDANTHCSLIYACHVAGLSSKIGTLQYVSRRLSCPHSRQRFPLVDFQQDG